VEITQASTDLDRALDGGGDTSHGLEVARLAGPGAVEVDDVEVLGPFLGPAEGRVDGIRVVGGLTLVVALVQAHGGSAAYVYRRVEDHRGLGSGRDRSADP